MPSTLKSYGTTKPKKKVMKKKKQPMRRGY